MNENDLYDLVLNDDWMMQVLQAANIKNLPDWWIGAGFLRNAVWDHLSGKPPRHDSDVDLVYFDPTNTTSERDWKLDSNMRERFPFAKWEVRNQARMHLLDNESPYLSTEDGISHWVETATCVGVLLHNQKLEFLFCHGSDDLLNMIARPIPTSGSEELSRLFLDRVSSKGWQQRWPKLRVIGGS